MHEPTLEMVLLIVLGQPLFMSISFMIFLNRGVLSIMLQESESEDDGIEIDVGDDDADAEEEPEHDEPEDAVPAEQEVEKPHPPLVQAKDTERQLSKKELKKKELAELDAVLAEFGISTNDNNYSQSNRGK